MNQIYIGGTSGLTELDIWQYYVRKQYGGVSIRVWQVKVVVEKKRRGRGARVYLYLVS